LEARGFDLQHGCLFLVEGELRVELRGQEIGIFNSDCLDLLCGEGV
jgi:hypothetical protein